MLTVFVHRLFSTLRTKPAEAFVFFLSILCTKENANSPYVVDRLFYPKNIIVQDS